MDRVICRELWIIHISLQNFTVYCYLLQIKKYSKKLQIYIMYKYMYMCILWRKIVHLGHGSQHIEDYSWRR